MIDRKQYKTERLILRPYDIGDYASWFDAYVNRLKKRNKYDRDPLDAKACTMNEFRKVMRRHERLAKDDANYVFPAFEKRTGTLIGVIDLFVIARDHYQMGNLGYLIHNRYWGRGFGKEVALQALRIGFKDLGLNRLEAAINLDNRRSINVATSIGMRNEGIKRRYIFEDNKWTDHMTFVANPEDVGMRPTKPRLL